MTVKSIDGLLIEQPLHIFWTTYDPLDLASGSLDPLGFARGYLALADRFLPTFTTVSTVPRYVSMLCAALKAAQTNYRPKSALASSKARQERLKLVKSYERAWALACGLAAQEATIGQKAVKGLRGVRYVRTQLDLSASQRSVKTGSFNLLANQVRYGGIGAYSAFLEECHLASMQNLTLRPLGEELAEAFPPPQRGMAVHDEDARLSMGALQEWGAHAHVSAFTKEEGIVLKRALQGGEEADRPDHVRWAALRMLKKLSPADEYDEGELLHNLAREIRDGTFDSLGVPADSLAQIGAALQILEPFEQFYQTFLFLFETIRGAATDEVEADLSRLAVCNRVAEASEKVRLDAIALLESLQYARGISEKTAMEIEDVLQKTGVIALVNKVSHTPDELELLRAVLWRHVQVQSGKFDKGLPKAAWVRFTDANDRVCMTGQRYHLEERQRPGSWTEVGRHAYRTMGAFAFIKACDIR